MVLHAVCAAVEIAVQILHIVEATALITEETVEDIAFTALLTVEVIPDHTEEKNEEIPPQMDWIVEDIAEQAEETVLDMPVHTEPKKDAMLFQVLWKKSETEDHTASQLVPNHPQKVSRMPVTMVTAPSMIPAHPSANP